MRGRVKWWSNNNGYGFIEYLDIDNLFVHCKEEIDVEDGSIIEFELDESKNTKYIYNLKVI